jgi:hypothetical protein
VIINHQGGIWIADNKTSASENGIIANNTMKVAAVGVDFAREAADSQPVRKILICNNAILLTDDDVAPLTLKPAFQMENEYAITDITFDGNRIDKTGVAVSSAGLYMSASGTAAQVNTGIRFINNSVRGVTYGVFLKTSATNGLGVIEVGGNHFINLDDTASDPNSAGILCTTMTSAIGQLIIQPNVFSDDTGGASFDYGILLGNGTISNFFLAPQSYRGLVSDYVESTLVVTLRRGCHSGTYTPTLANRTNVASSNPSPFQFSMVDKVVTVSGKLTLDPTGAGLAQLGISLPPGLASNFANEEELSGVAFSEFVAYEGASIYADTVNDRGNLEFIAVDTSNKAYRVMFSYRLV